MNDSPPSALVSAGASAALGRALATIGSAYEHGLRFEVSPGFIAYATGEPLARMNGLLLEHADARTLDHDRAEEAAAKITSLGLPWTVQVIESGLLAGLEDMPDLLTQRHDVVKTYVAPLTHVETPPVLSGFTIRTVTGIRGVDDFTSVLGAAFDMKGSLGMALVHPSTLSDSGIAAYVGYVGDEPVVSGYSVTDAPWIGVFAIGTLPERRHQGFAGAMTSWIMSEGKRAGATAAYLQASSMGLPLYERLGFRDAQDDIHYVVEPVFLAER